MEDTGWQSFFCLIFHGMGTLRMSQLVAKPSVVWRGELSDTNIIANKDVKRKKKSERRIWLVICLYIAGYRAKGEDKKGKRRE